jgi:Transglycosylase SLT domain
MDNQPTTTGSSPYSGHISLPDDGQVLSSDEPSTGSEAQAAPSTPTQGQPAGAPTPAQPAPGQQTPTGAQNAPTGKPTDLSKAPGQQTPGGAPQAPPVPPAVQKASVFHQVAEALAGGPRYKYDVDANGNMQKTPVPVSNAHIGMAIALEALQGTLTGLSQRGPEAAARGGAAAFAQQQQQKQQQDQQQQKMASDDYARRTQVAETNMRMYSMARQVGKMDEESTDRYIGQYHDVATKLQNEFPGYVKGPIKYSDFSKYNVTLDNAIPFSRVPRLDSNGQQVTDARGIPQSDINYLVVDPTLKASGLFDKDTIDTLKKMGKLPASSGDMLLNTPTSLMMALGLKSQAAQYNVAQQTFNHFFSTVDDATKSGNVATYKPTTAPTLPGDANALAEAAATKFGVPAEYIKGLMSQESGGNLNTPDSPTGAIGPMQLTSVIYKDKQFGVTDPRNVQQNVNAGTQYFSQLLHQYNDPKLAFAAYYSGPGAIDKNGKIVDTAQHTAADTTAYVNSVANKVGLQSQPTTAPQVNPDAKPGTVEGQANPATRLNQDQWTAKFSQTPADIEKFNSVLAQTEDNYGQAIAHLNASGQQSTAANISAFLGGPDAIALHDRALAEQRQQYTLDAQAAKTEKLAADKNALDVQAQQKKQAKLNTLETAQIPPNALQMNDHDLITNLQGQGVQLTPEDIRVAKAVARYEAPMNVASNKLWFKDATLNQQDVLDIVRQFNPSFDADNYSKIHQVNSANSPDNKTITAAAGIANHLNQLEQAAQEVANKGNGAGQYPALNNVKNWVNYQGGGTDYATLVALTNAVNGEIPKVLSGGFAPDKSQVDAVMKNMTAANSLQQIKALTDMYTGVMHGKIAPIDEKYNQLSGAADRHVSTIPKTLSQLFQKHGLETPWETGNQQLTTSPNPSQTPANSQTPNAVPSGAFAVRNPQGQIAGYKDAQGKITLFNQQPQQTQ